MVVTGIALSWNIEKSKHTEKPQFLSEVWNFILKIPQSFGIY